MIDKILNLFMLIILKECESKLCHSSVNYLIISGHFEWYSDA